MCGRFTLTASPEEIAELCRLLDIEPFPPRFNIAPGQPILVVIGGADERFDAHKPGRTGLLTRWGLIPAWVKDLSGFPLLFNARAESVGEKQAFRAALRYRRCLVPASGFYEWARREGEAPQPYFVRPRQNGAIAFAGLMETWLSAEGSEIDTATILTTESRGALAEIHPRMPLVLRPEQFDRWLNCRDHAPGDVADLLQPGEPDGLEAVAVSNKINKLANLGPDVQEPAAANPPPEAARGAQLRLL